MMSDKEEKASVVKIMFRKNNSKSELVEPIQEEIENHTNVTSGEEYPDHKSSKMGDLHVNTITLRPAVAVHYPHSVAWIDLLDTTKILAKDSDLTKPVEEDFRYESAIHGKKFWAFADEENSYVDIANQNLAFKLDAEKNGSFAFDLGKPVADRFVLKFNLNLKLLSPQKEGLLHCFIGLGSHDQNSPANAQQNFIGIALSLAIIESQTGNSHVMQDSQGYYRTTHEWIKTRQFKIGAFDVRDGNLNEIKRTFSHNLTLETLAVEIIRIDATHYRINLYSEDGVLIESQSVECSNPINLRYFCGKNTIDTRNKASISGTISNVKFYNEVTSV